MGLTVGGVIAIILIIIGIIMLIIGIVLFERDVSNKTSNQWYVWLLLIGGLILAIIGGIWLAYDLRKHNTVKVGVPGSTADAGEVKLEPVQSTIYTANVPPQVTVQQPQTYTANVPAQVTVQQQPPPQYVYQQQERQVIYSPSGPPPQGAVFSGYNQPMYQQMQPQPVTYTNVPPQQITSRGIEGGITIN